MIMVPIVIILEFLLASHGVSAMEPGVPLPQIPWEHFMQFINTGRIPQANNTSSISTQSHKRKGADTRNPRSPKRPRNHNTNLNDSSEAPANTTGQSRREAKMDQIRSWIRAPNTSKLFKPGVVKAIKAGRPSPLNSWDCPFKDCTYTPRKTTDIKDRNKLLCSHMSYSSNAKHQNDIPKNICIASLVQYIKTGGSDHMDSNQSTSGNTLTTSPSYTEDHLRGNPLKNNRLLALTTSESSILLEKLLAKLISK